MISDEEEVEDQQQETGKDSHEQAKEKASNLIIQVEQFKASVNDPPPQGTQAYPEHDKEKLTPQCVENNAYFQEDVKDDDDYFHLTCHVDSSLVSKIERGEFVELEKLVQNKNKSRSITGIRKWEQAFRVYAAVYSQANPGRSAEIWQYVYVINAAASTHPWTQVADYDFAFRQMMSTNPKRSWARIYHQMWNICLSGNGNNNSSNNTNFGSRSGSFNLGGNSFSVVSSNSASSSRQNPPRKDSSKPDYCWKFNKGKCKFGNDCRFINRCSYCDSAAHERNACPQKAQANVNNQN